MKREILTQSSKSIITYDTRHFICGKSIGYLTTQQWKEDAAALKNGVIKKKCNRVIVDQSELRGTWLPVMSWLIDELTPQIIGKAPFKLALIYSKDKAAVHSLNRFLELSDSYFGQVSYQAFEDEPTAIEWLLDQPTTIKNAKELELLSVKIEGKHQVINTEKIYYLWTKRNMVYIVTKDKTFATRAVLTNMLKVLPPYFQQIHRGYLINLKKLDTISYYAGGSYVAYLQDFPDLRLSVGRKYAPSVKKSLGIRRNW